MNSLIVDDEASARSRLTRLLSAHQGVHIVGEAANGLEAIEKIEQLRPDLVFLDIQIPGLDGFQVLRSLPSGTPRPLIIFRTAGSGCLDRAEQRSACAKAIATICET